MKPIIILTNANSISARAIITKCLNINQRIEKVIIIKQNSTYYLKLFKFVAKRVGVIEALVFSFQKLILEFIHEVFFCELKSIQNLISEHNIPSLLIKGTKSWQNEARKSIDQCQSKVILIGQTGILGPEFNLVKNDRLFLNCHPGYLPNYRGLDSFKWTLADKNFKLFASTIHIVRDKIDAGEIVNIKPFTWRRVNWFFSDRELLIIGGNHLVEYLSKLDPADPVNHILKNSTNQSEEYPLRYKMNILNEIKTFKIYIMHRNKSV